MCSFISHIHTNVTVLPLRKHNNEIKIPVGFQIRESIVRCFLWYFSGGHKNVQNLWQRHNTVTHEWHKVISMNSLVSNGPEWMSSNHQQPEFARFLKINYMYMCHVLCSVDSNIITKLEAKNCELHVRNRTYQTSKDQHNLKFHTDR